MGDVVVVGGGIGGLTAAHAVVRAGQSAVVVERAIEPTAVGAGLVLWPNAVRALDALGLGEAVREIGAPARHTTVTDARGREISRIDTAALAERAGAPMLLVERPTLHAVLARGLTIHRGASVTAVDADGVTLTGGERIAAEAVIGADGIGSVVRAYVAPDAAVIDTGKIAVRAVAPFDTGAGRVSEAWGAGELFGVAGLRGNRTYWFYEARAGRLTTDGADATVAALRERVRGWPAPFAACIDHTNPADLLVHPVRVTAPLARWSRGTVAVLGDAAHAMEPNLGQGAAQAIEDAVALAQALTDDDDLATALATYGAARRSRAHRIQRESGRMARIALASRLTRVRDTALRAVPGGLRQRAVVRLTVA